MLVYLAFRHVQFNLVTCASFLTLVDHLLVLLLVKEVDNSQQ